MGFNPVDQEIARVRQHLLDKGVIVATDLDWQFMLAHWAQEKQAERMEKLVVKLTEAISSQPQQTKSKKQLASQAAVPGGIFTLIAIQVLQALQSVA